MPLMRSLVALLLVGGGLARADTPVAIDRELAAQQLQIVYSQLALAQRQLASDPAAWSTPAGHTLGRTLDDALARLNEVQRQLSYAPQLGPAPETPSSISAGAAPSFAPPPPQFAGAPIDAYSLRALAGSIAVAPVREERLRALDEAVVGHYFFTAQVMRLLPLFALSEDRVRALELLAPRILDPQHLSEIRDAFFMSGDEARVRKILSR